jgi:Xaa-Pro aminopeptidase
LRMGNERLVNIKKLLVQQSCSHILVTDTIDVEYISGFRSSNASLLITKRRNFLFTDFRYRESAEKFCRKNDAWKFICIQEGNFTWLTPYISAGSTIGYQSNTITVDQFQELRHIRKGLRFTRLSNQITDLSIRKTDREVRTMDQAAGIGDTAFMRVVKYLKVGVTEIEIARKLERICTDLGSQRPAFETIVLFGARSALPHGHPGTTRLHKGDWVLFDFGCTVDNFYSDMTRTVVAGKASARQRQFYDVVYRAQAHAREKARADIKASELDSYARSPIEAAGYGAEFGHATGHGVGLRIHERPRVSPHVDARLHERTVVTIEPGIYIPGFGGVRIEDMVVLKKERARLITHAPRELMEIGL